MKNDTIVAEVGLTYKTVAPISGLPKITSPDSAYELLITLFDQNSIQLQEHFLILLLDTQKRCLGYSNISKGGSSSTIVEPKFIFQTALLSNADSILLGHNHPSGELVASAADISLTKRIEKSARLLGIELVDHLIISNEGFLSMRSKGLL